MPVTDLVKLPQGLDAELILEFFLVFSRFEYAIKSAGLLNPARARAEADWDALADRIADGNAPEVERLKAAGEYLLAEPPKRQDRDGNMLKWTPVPSDRDRPVHSILGSVRRVRNNLFHGGKYDEMGRLNDRNERLVTSSLAVLDAALEAPMCADVRDYYLAYAPEPE